MTFLRSVVWTGAFAVLIALSDVRDADACGGCFHQAQPAVETDPSVVTDHRMVFEITTQQTILWDQVRYTGNPSEFAWVLPVRAGARVELSHGEWITALDNATLTTVTAPPQPVCPNTATPTSYSGGSSNSGGCSGTTSLDSSYSDGTGAGDEDASSSGSFQPTPGVDVVSQSTIGPYQSVTIHATGTTGIQDWLVENGFAVPEYMAPVIDSYTSQGLDFIALKLRPGVGVQAMRPVRIITPGADATLPLRMVAAGIGAHVGLTLWVIGEGRYETQNFPPDTIDWANALTWSAATSSSNHSELEAAALATNGGRTWVTEAAVTTSLSPYSFGLGSGATLPELGAAYTTLCEASAPRTVPCDDTSLPPADGQPDGGSAPDAGDDAGDDPSADAGDDDAGDAGVADAGGAPDGGGACYKVQYGCDGYDDLDVASVGLHEGDIWITRLRADLPIGTLNAELQLMASPNQDVLSPSFQPLKYDPPFDPCAASRANAAGSDDGSRGSDGCVCRTTPTSGDVGTWTMIGITMVALPLVTRRRRR